MYKPCEHPAWILIVPDPIDAPERGVQQCTSCLVEVDRIHPLPAPVLLAYEDVPLTDWERELLLDRSPFGPLATGLARPTYDVEPSDLAPHLHGAVVNVTEAVAAFKETQPELDRVRQVKKRNDEAREVLVGHMKKKGVTEFRGISLREVPFETWDDSKLRGHLGDQVADFRRSATRRYLNLIKRKS